MNKKLHDRVRVEDCFLPQAISLRVSLFFKSRFTILNTVLARALKDRLVTIIFMSAINS